MNNNSERKKGGFWELLKKLFLLLILIQFAPAVFMNIKSYVQEAITPKSHVGLLKIRGVIEDSTFYVKQIEQFLKAPEIKALMLKIDSPGGLPGSSQAIYSALLRFKKEKPVVALVENVCASAAYYVACGCDHIIATPSALVGSVGVVLQLPNIKELLESWKVKFSYIQSGKYKTAGSPLKEMTPEEKEYLQQLSEEHYQQFINDVAKSRKLDLKKQKIWADGKIFTGNKALELKLIDQIGSHQEAVEEIKKLAEIEEEIKFVQPKQPSAFARFFGAGDEDYDSQQHDFSSSIANTLCTIYEKFMAKQKAENHTVELY